jgi:hypothetical protein
MTFKIFFEFYLNLSSNNNNIFSRCRAPLLPIDNTPLSSLSYQTEMSPLFSSLFQWNLKEIQVLC